MTLAPAEEWHLVERAEGPKLVPNQVCSVPGCGRVSTDGHHIWRRSFTAGPVDWITFDGRALANKTWLCVEHHAQVNGGIGGHTAHIRLIDMRYWWYAVEYEEHYPHWVSWGQIDPQPAGCAGAIVFPEVAEEEETVIPDHICPDCGKVHKHRKKKPVSDIEPDGLERLPAAPKTRVQITVPDTEQENGAELIDDMLEELAVVFGISHYESKLKRYHTLVHVCEFTRQNQELARIDMRGEGIKMTVTEAQAFLGRLGIELDLEGWE